MAPENTFTDLSFPDQYPQHEVAEHEVLLSFRNDSDAVHFREWWHHAGASLFGDYMAQVKCEHVWTGKKINVPGEPDDYVEFCEKCGMENPGSWVE